MRGFYGWCTSSMARLRHVMIHFVLISLYVYIFTSAEETGTGAARTGISIGPQNRVTYSREAELKAKCPKWTLRDPQADTQNDGRRPLMERLSFRNGDWEQAEIGGTPIIPFLALDDSKLPAKIQLASFWVADVAHDQEQVRQLRGIVELTVVDGKHAYSPLYNSFYGDAGFRMERGLSVLGIEVEGIYQQTENEDVVCMLGCAYLPSSDGGIHFSNIQNVGGTKTLEKDCNIKVQLNYPLKYNLTSRVVRGTIQSLVSPGDHYNFSPIRLSSQISAKEAYESTASNLVKSTCASPLESTAAAYKASTEDFCVLTMEYLSDGSMLDIDPSWRCNGTVQYCQKIGPFSSYEEHTSFLVDYNTSRAQILVQSFQIPCFSEDEIEGFPVSFVLRLVPADETIGVARERSALDGQTLVAEGYWTNTSDTLCMVACKLDDDSGQADICNVKITLHVPLSLSITQHDVFKGSITSRLPPDHPESFFPLTFHVKLEFNRNLPFQFSSRLRYNYTRLDEAGAVLSQYEPESNALKTSLFKYPSLMGEEEGHYQSLARDLSLHYGLKTNQMQKFEYIDFDLVAFDSYLPLVWSGFMAVPEALPLDAMNDTIVTDTNPKWTHRRQEPRKYLNCSGTMLISGHVLDKSNTLSILTEGYYSPTDGKMFMVGCRSVKANLMQIEKGSFDLIAGMDCEIDIVLEYPTTVAAWLLNPGVTVKVHSNRPADDVFHFDDINTETGPVLYRRQRESIVSRKGVEGALSILTLSLTLVCIITQVLHLGSHADSTPYISLVMVGAQAMRYAIPLVTGAESLLTRKSDYRKNYYFQETHSIQMITYVDKILTLVALLLLLRLFEKVWRKRGLHANLKQDGSVPREWHVVVICFALHVVGFLSVMVLYSQNSVTEPDAANEGMGLPPVELDPASSILSLEETRPGPLRLVSQEYAGLIEDLFLLPQAVGFSLWDVTGRPLKLSFFGGLTLLQIVPHVYDYFQDPGVASYRYHLYANSSFNFYTKVGNLLIPALALSLALLVYSQQRWKGFLRFPSRFPYRRLETKTSETELVTTNGRSHLPPIPEDDE